jgi:hypothetical protein
MFAYLRLKRDEIPEASTCMGREKDKNIIKILYIHLVLHCWH